MSKTKTQALLEFLMKEDNPPPRPQNTQDVESPDTPVDVSLDSVIDRYIVRYEKDSIPTAETYEDELYGEPTFESVLYEALNEAPEDEELDIGADEEGADAEPPADDGGDLELGGGEEDMGGGESEAPAPEQPVMATPQINLLDFTRNIARLVNNYDALLNPKNTILRRVEKYIESNYDVRTAKEFMELMDKNYSLSPDDQNEQEWPTPYAQGALSSEG